MSRGASQGGSFHYMGNSFINLTRVAFPLSDFPRFPSLGLEWCLGVSRLMGVIESAGFLGRKEANYTF